MSHVCVVDLEIRDLDCLAKACKRIGLELHEGQKTYRWYGRHVGDYALPEGFMKEDLGKCSHAIAIPGSTEAYEIGVVQRRDGKQAFCLQWDFFAGGYGMEAKVGEGCVKLKQAYAAEVALKHARFQGFSVKEELRADGSLRLTLNK